MEWVESTGKTIADAKEVALDRLGVHEDDAEFEVIADAKLGFLGRVKEDARVRARVQPATPRASHENTPLITPSPTATAAPNFCKPHQNTAMGCGALAKSAIAGGGPSGSGRGAAKAARSRKPAAAVDPAEPSTWGKVQRNVPCPCGSGKKYKHCHGAYS